MLTHPCPRAGVLGSVVSFPFVAMGLILLDNSKQHKHIAKLSSWTRASFSNYFLGKRRGFTEYLHTLEAITSDLGEVKGTMVREYCEPRPKYHKDEEATLKSPPDKESLGSASQGRRIAGHQPGTPLGQRLVTGTLGRALGQDVAALLASANPDSGLLGWSCRKSLRTIPWEAGEERAQGQC